MSIDLYFAGSAKTRFEDQFQTNNCNRLFTFADKSNREVVNEQNHKGKIFMDSGAFSVHSRGKIITLDEYIDYINNTPRVDLFAALDVIPLEKVTSQSTASAQQSRENYCYMLDHVKPEYRDKIVPTYHYSEPFSYLEEMLKGYHGYQPAYIAFGGRVGTPTKHLYSSLDRFFETIKKSSVPNIKVHGFGISVIKVMEAYPFTSVDSTTWLKTSINGGIHLDILDGMVMRVNPKLPESYWNKSKELQDLCLREILKYGGDIKELTDSCDARTRYNIDYFIRLQSKLQYKERFNVKRRRLF